MLHTRIALIGSEAARAAAMETVVEAGGTAVSRPDGKLIWAVAGDLPALEALTRDHPDVTFGVEMFEEFGVEIVNAVIAGGQTTQLSRQAVLDDGLPDHLGDGDVLDASELARAGRMIQYRDSLVTDEPSSPLEIAMEVARSLGRFAARATDTPDVETLQAVADLGDAALHLTSAGGQPACAADDEFRRALALTRAALHARRFTVEDDPWSYWLGELLADASRIIAAAHEAERCENAGCPCEGAIDFMAGGLVTTCLQVLAIFQPEAVPGR